MENARLLNKIKSSILIKHIFNYIKDNNIKFKLFFYSKSFQKKFNIKLNDYKEKYFDKIDFNISKYLEEEKNKNNYLNEEYDNYSLEKKFNEEKFNNILNNISKNKKSNKINDDIIKEGFKTLINLDSPLFELISKTNNFDKDYTICICQKKIDEYKLKEK